VYPALALIALALGVALRRSFEEAAVLLLSLNFCCAAKAIVLVYGHRSGAAMIVLFFATALSVMALASQYAPALRSLRGRLEPLAAATLAGAAFSLMSFGLDFSALSRALSRLPPHPTMLAISGNLGVGHPLVRQIGGIWVQSVCSLWISEGARNLIAQNADDPDLARRLAPYFDKERDMLVNDIKDHRPDAILITKRAGEWAWSNPAIAAALTDYRFFASDGASNSDSEIKIFARHDLVELRAALPEKAGAPDRIDNGAR
jgi:hypothetical protein